MPSFGVRLGEEDEPMLVEIINQKACSVELPRKSTYSAILEINLSWRDDYQDDQVLDIAVARDLSVVIQTYPEVRLISLVVALKDRDNGPIARQVVGDDLWRLAEGVIEQGHDCRRIVVEPKSLLALIPTWEGLIRLQGDYNLRFLPLDKEVRDREMEELTSDPEFLDKGKALLRELFGENSVQQSFRVCNLTP
jgi:hypothetical protein